MTSYCTQPEMIIDYKIKYSDRKKLTITVERDRAVVVKAPRDMDPEKIHDIVESKRPWLYKHLNHPRKYEDIPHPPGKELVSGESLLYLGKEYRIEMLDSVNPDIQFDRKFIINRNSKIPTKDLVTRWYKEKAKEQITPRVYDFANNLGVSFDKVDISDMRYRWGSCTPNNNLRFNWRLIKAAMNVIDYVIVHELAHLIEGNHSPRFWNIVKVHSPSYEKARYWLRENGSLLEQDVS